MNSKKKIALVVSHPIQHFCPQYASFAQHPEIEFEVFFASSLGLDKYIDPNFKREISWDKLPIEQFTHHFVNGRKPLPSNPQLDAPSIGDALKKFDPQLVIIYGYYHQLDKRVHRWARANRVPLAYISDSELRQQRTGWKQVAKKLWLRWYFSKISYFLSVGDANEDFYRQHGVPSNKIVRMHFSIDKKLYDQSYQRRDELRSSIRSKLGIGEGRVVASVVGKLVSWKNQDHLVDAIIELENRGVQMDAMIVGSGETEGLLREKMSKLSMNRVHMVGFVNTDELPAYYAASDIYVHPASREPHSIAISEAIAMELPIICSDRCGSHGPSDDVRDGENGYVFPFGDIPSLADKLALLSNSKEQRTTMGAISRSLSEKFQLRSHGGVIDELLIKLREVNV